MSVPSLQSAKEFARQSFRAMPQADQVIRFRLCDWVEKACIQACEDEDLEILRVSAYLQEVGVIHSSKQKPIYSIEMCKHFYRVTVGDLDEGLVECIRTHVKEQTATTPEARLMQICHKYITTHYLDYMMLKHRISEAGFEKLQLQRIDAFKGFLSDHPRGKQIDKTLTNWWHAKSE